MRDVPNDNKNPTADCFEQTSAVFKSNIKKMSKLYSLNKNRKRFY